MVSWPEIQAGIFAGESGGDYGALYGYSNRPGGAFQGVNLQDMTVGQVADFTSPSGPYGQWVKGQVGRVATPVGAYQVVGTTLRDAIKAGAVDPSQPFNRETQDRLGRWIYETQGTGAWEGYRGPQPSGGQSMQVSRGQPMEPNFTAPQQERPRRNMADVRDRLILALEGMTLNPNQGLMQVAASGLKERAEGRRTTQSQNRTAEWLRSQGRDDLAQAVMAGALGGRDAAALAYQPQNQNFRQVRGSDLGLTGENADKLFNVGPDGKVTAIGGAGTTFNVGDSGPQVGTIPQGYQLRKDETGAYRMEPILGGPADTSRQTQTGAENQAVSAVNVLDATEGLREAIEESPLVTTGFAGAILRNIPGSTAYDAQATSSTIKANLAFDALAAMRAASPTGGALGAVSEKELLLLESQIANLDLGQSTGRVLRSLATIEDQYKRILQKAYATGDPAALDAFFGGRPNFVDMPKASSGSGFSVRGVIE